MKQPADYDLSKVHATAGLALHAVQTFENSFEVFLTVHKNLSNRKITVSELESYDQEVRKKTLGGLLKEVRKQITFDDSVEEVLVNALEKRNYFVHKFYKAHALTSMTVAGREQMIKDLCKLLECFVEANEIAGTLVDSAALHLGISVESLIQEYQNSKEQG